MNVIWGGENIAKALNCSKRQAFYLLERGHVQAKKVGAKWCTTEEALKLYLADIPAPARMGISATSNEVA